jgi:hypothetical protein
MDGKEVGMRQEPVSLSEASRFFGASDIQKGASMLGVRPFGNIASKAGVTLMKDDGRLQVRGPDDAILQMRRVIAGGGSPPLQES